MAYAALPADGVMMLHTIVKPSDEEFEERELPVTMTHLRFFKFIMDEIFPGGDLPPVAVVEEHATKAGFEVKLVQPLRLHYARTLDIWAAALEARKDEAIAIQSAGGLRPVHEVPDRLRGPVPRGLHRRLPVHPGQELGFTGADGGDRVDHRSGIIQRPQMFWRRPPRSARSSGTARPCVCQVTA